MASSANDQDPMKTDDAFQTTEQVLDDNASRAATSGSQQISIYSSMLFRSFKDFMLKPELLRAIKEFGFEHPSEVQLECIPLASLGMDMMCQAKPGTGKTAVFVLATLQQMEPIDGAVSVVVLCHTRELAYQTRNHYERFSQYMSNVRTGVFFGGTSTLDDIEKLTDPRTYPHIIVGTPGRLVDLLQSRYLVLNEAKFFILDECDMMLTDLDMRSQAQEIFFAMSRKKQVMMFSATLPPGIRRVYRKFMHEPMEIWVADGELISSRLQQYSLQVQEYDKSSMLTEIMDRVDFEQVCIFVNSVPRAIDLNEVLRDCYFPSTCIHSDLDQDERIKRYNDFKAFRARIMVATDIFGRGVDIDKVNLVINYDVPHDAETYIHRVNRAGRFGTEATAISFTTTSIDEEVLKDVQARFEVEIKPYDSLY